MNYTFMWIINTQNEIRITGAYEVLLIQYHASTTYARIKLRFISCYNTLMKHQHTPSLNGPKKA